MVSDEEIEKLVRTLSLRQGFLVMGWVSKVKIGHKTNRAWSRPLGFEMQVVAEAEPEEWHKQNDLIAKLHPEWTRFPDNQSGFMYRMKLL